MKKKSLMDFTEKEIADLNNSTEKLKAAQSEEELNKALMDVMDTMGIEPQWRTPEEFDALMMSGEPIKIGF